MQERWVYLLTKGGTDKVGQWVPIERGFQTLDETMDYETIVIIDIWYCFIVVLFNDGAQVE